MKIGVTVKHKKYGMGLIIPSDDVSISKIMVKFNNESVVSKYVCFDGILPEELEIVTT